MWVEAVSHWLEKLSIEPTALTKLIVALGLIVLIAIVTHFVLHQLIRGAIERLANTRSTERLWKRALFEKHLFKRFLFIVQALIIQVQAQHWLESGSTVLLLISSLTQLWILLFTVLLLFALLDVLLELFQFSQTTRDLPLRGIFQGIKLTAVILAAVIAVSVLIGKSPVILFSGLGAMTAVLLLIFKDPLMGLVAGIQLSANKMLSVGDWLEMSRYGADGAVVDINLTTVKVQNWDKTITTIPTYALISDSFKNWRGMQESGGRRIMRSVSIDVSSVGFLTEEDCVRLRKSKVLSHYIEQKLADITYYNEHQGADLSLPLNGRRLTNIGTFRAYLENYLKTHPHIHQKMTLLVRQLEVTPDGVPIQIYAFTNTTVWAEYEAIQADIFDHLLAIVPVFGLRLHQAPTGHDIRQIKLAGMESVIK
ncbi:miniconductance mechanosensitive channel [Nitrincola tibetensis]|uniref:Mechanosensing system component YbdG n=1 Tax=Nitrincola tibetensis TaxID=2219697 RepID=A0A364NKS5_9GAMM|nr:mechanosensitive ion channel domain-containing protein [Nitrincola tibetensis]RAU17634.1 miniconductance mechanosensitive channel [Nitrincola tibetensis]